MEDNFLEGSQVWQVASGTLLKLLGKLWEEAAFARSSEMISAW
jgi:hypothetical protein